MHSQGRHHVHLYCNFNSCGGPAACTNSELNETSGRPKIVKGKRNALTAQNILFDGTYLILDGKARGIASSSSSSKI